jgi:hypothetical protein
VVQQRKGSHQERCGRRATLHFQGNAASCDLLCAYNHQGTTTNPGQNFFVPLHFWNVL